MKSLKILEKKTTARKPPYSTFGNIENSLSIQKGWASIYFCPRPICPYHKYMDTPMKKSYLDLYIVETTH